MLLSAEFSKTKWLLGSAALLLVLGTAIVFALYLKTSLSGVPLSAPTVIESDEEGTDSFPDTDGPATIVTGAVLVRAPQNLALEMREITEGTSPSPNLIVPSAASVPGPPPDTALNLVPELRTVGATDITPAIPQPPFPADQKLADLDRWFVIDVSVEEFEVNVTNQETLEVAEASDGEATNTPEQVQSLIELLPSPTAEPVSSEAQLAVEQTKNIITTLKNSGRFEAVEPVILVTTTAIPNDSSFAASGSWQQPYDDLWGLKRIQAPAAWDVSKGSDSTLIAVVDTGIDLRHPDLQGNLYENMGEIGVDAQGNDKKSNGLDDDTNGYIDDWRGWNFRNNTNNPYDDRGHGTHVAGTIAAVGNNGTGVVGVMWQAKLLPIKFLGSDGSGTSTNGAASIRYAADRGARVINNSWGGLGFSEIIHDAVEYAHARGSLVVAAAGNDSRDIDSSFYSPASEMNVLAVSALTPSDTLASFSNFGHKVELTAPGGDNSSGLVNSILSLRISTPGYSYGESLPGTLLTRLAGTSMAAPHVTGVAGLVFAVHSDWTNTQVKQQLLQTADDLGQAGPDKEFGFGLVNAARAVAASSVQLSINSPQEEQITRSSPLSLIGSAGGDNFETYSLEVGKGYRPTSWTTINQSSSTTNNGSLGTWPSEHGFFTFRLTLNPARADRVQILRHGGFDREIREGWPIELSRGWRTAYSYLSSPALGDIDGDGHKEIIAHHPATNKASVFNRSGSLVWEKNLEPNPNLDPFPVTAYDVDQDGLDNVIVNSLSKIHIFNQQGNDVSGWPQSALTGEVFVGSPTIARIEQNDATNLVAFGINSTNKSGHLYAWKKDGTAVSGWPKSFTIPDRVRVPTLSIPAGVSAYDVNGDGTDELFFGLPLQSGRTNPQLVIYGFSANGHLLPNWPVTVQDSESTNNRNTLPGGVSIGNVTGDPLPEVVAVTFNGSVVVLRPDGSVVSGWPKKIMAGPNKTHSFWGFPLLIDLTGDGLLDILIGDRHALTGNGTIVSGWEPLTGTGQVASVSYSVPAPTALNSNAMAILVTEEVVNESGFLQGLRLLGFDSQGTALPEWTKTIAGFTSSSPVTGDLDMDGKLEIVAIGVRNEKSYLFVWNKDVPIQGEAHQWPTLNGDPAHTHIFPRPAQSWQNPRDRFDVNNDGSRSQLDFGVLNDSFNSRGPRDLINVNEPPPPPYIDVNGDGMLDILDLLDAQLCMFKSDSNCS